MEMNPHSSYSHDDHTLIINSDPAGLEDQMHVVYY